MPCGKISMPPPKLVSNFPDGSNFRIEGRLDPAQLLAPARSPTHRLPSRSKSTALVDPHARPSGSLNQFSTVRYGFGRLACADATAAAHKKTGSKSRIRTTLPLSAPLPDRWLLESQLCDSSNQRSGNG